MVSSTGWDRSAGTSKKEQGILTPPQPRRHHCGCWYRGTELWQICNPHQQGLAKIIGELQRMAKEKQPQNAAEVISDQIKNAIPTPPSTPWVENVKTAEEVKVNIITPEK